MRLMKTRWSITILMLVLVSGTSWAKDTKPEFLKKFDLSFNYSAGYDRAVWMSGLSPAPAGTKIAVGIPHGFNVQVKYNDWIVQPTLEFGYRWEHFDFSDRQAPIQEANPQSWHILLGITVDLRYFNAYLLGGVTKINYYPSILEAYPIPLDHGKDIGAFEEWLPTIKVGAYKLFKLGFWGIKAGPEISVEGYTHRPGWRRCREMNTNQIVPNVGVRIQW